MAWVLVLALFPGIVRGQVPGADPVALASSIAGRVCDDQDGDGQCGGGEPGLLGVRVVLATGREVLTDAQGRYHLTGVDARAPEVTGGIHLRPGRHRLRVDLRTIPARGRVSPEAATVEVPWGAAVLQDFAVRLSQESVGALAPSPEAPPQAEVREGGVSFTVSGQASPGDEVRVAGQEAQVDAAGLYRAAVALRPGENLLHIVASSPGGSVRLFRQRFDVVKQGEGRWLIAPRALEPLGQVRLPAGRGEPVPSGTVSLHVEAAEGTRVRLPKGEWVVGPQGSVEVPFTLVPGPNRVELELMRPGELFWTYAVELVATARPFFVGLLDLEGTYSPGNGTFQLLGRGAAHGEARWGAFHLLGEVDLRDTDFRTLHSEDTASGWLRPRLPERFERSPDPEFSIEEWADDSVSLTPNAAEGRLRLEVQHDTHGRVGFGTYRALMAEGEIGRYHHPLFGPFAEVKAKAGSLQVGVDAFAGGMSEPVRGVSTRPAHEELRATGGSLYFLGASSIVEGSELLRVEYRDGLTGLPLSEHHLVRGRDYELDTFSGRILLAKPLSFLSGASWLGTDALTAAPEPVLVADYAAIEFSGARDAVGGEAWAEWPGSVRLTLGGVRERRAGAPYQLLSGRAQGTLGGYALQAEVASSSGWAVGSDVFGVSDDGGLSYLRPSGDSSAEGEALGLRAHGPGPLGGGSVDAAFRWRSQGFSDGAHVESAFFRQLSLRASQPLGPFRLTLLGDDRRSADPRQPFDAGAIAARTLGAGVGYEHKAWGVRVEVRDSWLRAAEVAGADPLLEGGRTSVGLQGRLQVHERVVLSAGHRQALVQRGEGLGRVDDTFASAGVDVTLDPDTTVGLRGGWGPELGPQVWANTAMHRGPDVYYGGYSVDVDGPDFGMGRAVTGARTDLEDGTSVFVEDVSAHDANAVRLARAVGFQQILFGGFQVGGRYERGVRHPLDVPSSLKRDTASLFGQWVRERFRLEGRAELRHERGTPVRGPPVAVNRVQTLVALAAETLLRENLTLSGRVNFARTGGVDGLRGRLLEGSSGVAWRPGPWLLVARYSILREQVPGERSAFGERVLQVVSLLPAVRLGDRLSVAAGVHLGRSQLGREAAWVGTGTLRPSVRVVGGLEVGAEVARRTSAREGESLSSVRGELGYQVDAGLRFAAGYTVLGFKGLGLSGDAQDEADRFYVRAEVAY
ncbi:hypothetical protein [Stigmatella aurantiaca]|uniref:Conserved uncharacterized protein n=2 Tax=Stigmatella aurantiaca (strain DW4/3-1) TaxID=378806 RepID=E3FCS6_STIAD|nr:hypothetical protein [Stigmatella aurantiaca]ADO72574.1 conserved uncharacterized protein [Stigmatella aurantiaca DW4/3-1]